MKHVLAGLISTAMLAACAHGEVGDSQLPDGQCPDVAGAYREQGVQERDSGQREIAHLAWLIDGRELTANPLRSPPSPGQPSVYYVTSFNIDQPGPALLRLTAFNEAGQAIGKFSMGESQGWLCDRGAFVKYVAGKHGGEGGGWTESETTRIRRNATRELEVAKDTQIERRDFWGLGAPTSRVRRMTSIQRFEPVEKP